MKQNLKIFLCIAIVVLIVLIRILYVSNALYKTKVSGNELTSVASPKVRLINETTNVSVLDLNKYTHEFSVVNYDSANNITEVSLDYKLAFELTDIDAPISMKLYKIENGQAKEIELNNLETKNSFSFTTNGKQEDNYKLEMWFNLESGKMDENTNINVKLKSFQTEPKK